MRVIGKGSGFKVNFEYNAFQPVVGLFSYEWDGETLAFGAYEDDCHAKPTRLPFGFETFNLPSIDEATGKNTISSMTWVNEEDGVDAQEELEKIIEKEFDEDIAILEPPKAETVVNINFDLDVDVVVNTPFDQSFESKDLTNGASLALPPTSALKLGLEVELANAR